MRVEIGESAEAVEKTKEFMVFFGCLGASVLPPNAEGNISLPEEMVASDLESENGIAGYGD